MPFSTSLSLCTGDEDVEPVEPTPETSIKDYQFEQSISNLIRAARNKFVKRALVGKIAISRVSGVVTTQSECIVTERDTNVEEVDENAFSASDRRALSMIGAVLTSLESRAKAYEYSEYKENMVLSRGAFIGFSVPIFVSIGFSFAIQLSATVGSLLKARRKYQEYKDFQKCLKHIKKDIVEEVARQGVPLQTAQRAVIATNNTTVEAALKWIEKNVKQRKEEAPEPVVRDLRMV